jgi:hypothetical protein
MGRQLQDKSGSMGMAFFNYDLAGPEINMKHPAVFT